MGDLKRTAAYLKDYKKSVIIALVCAFAGSVVNVLIPQIVSNLADIISAGMETAIDISAIWRIAAVSAAVILLGFVFSYSQSYILSGVSQRLSKDIRLQLSNKIDRLPLSYLDSGSVGDILSRTTNDVDMFSKVFTTTLGTTITNLVVLVGCIVMMFISSPLLAVVAIGATFIGLIVMGAASGISGPLFRKSRSQLGSLNALIDETLSGHLVIKSFNCEDEVRESFDAQNKKLSEYDWKSQFVGGLMNPIMVLAGNMAYVAVCICGAYLMIKYKNITVGTIVSFIMYVKLFSTPLSALSGDISKIQPALAAQARIFELLDAEENVHKESTGITSAKGEVVFENVKFGYLPGQTIIHDFSASVKPGMKVAIVGPTGAGKSTLVNLLMRFYELNGGRILLDGKSIADMSLEDLHSVIGMVLQETWVFEGTIRDNIIYSAQNISEERFNEVLKETGLDQMISSYKDGADTVISEKMELSSGQVQLITIARAMIKNPSVMILDEATSSIDTRTELIIQKAIDSLTKDRTSFVIAHRLSTIRNADVIFVMKDGDIMETGNHEELLAKGGIYADLYYSQFSDGKETDKKNK